MNKKNLGINIVSKDTVIFGNLVTRSSVEVFGEISQPSGRHPAISSSGNVFIDKDAVVKGDIKANDIIIEGKLEGNIIAAGNVTLIDGCAVSGNIESSGLTIGEKVIFEGKVINKLTQKQEQVSIISKMKTIPVGYFIKLRKLLKGVSHVDSKS